MSGTLPNAGQLPLSLARRVDQVCDRFEEDWLAGRRPRIEEYLDGVPEEARRALLRELLRVELEQRRRGGDPPATEDYRGRFPDHIGLISTLLVRLSPPPGSQTDRLDANGEPAVPRAEGDAPLPAVPGYKVLRAVGRGGMGVVYEARQVALNRPVALKMILSGTCAGERERARFWAEAEAVARLRHPNIVQIYEVGEHEGRPYLSLEYVEGGTLAQQLKTAPQSPRAAAGLVEVLARAVHAAHQQGVVHRDLKPGNVLLARDGAVKITDFGLAKRLDGDTGQTASGTILGTPSYMAPEQAAARGPEIGTAADVYALGAILYEALTGRPPFQGATLLDTLEQVRSQEAVPPSRLQPKTPRDLETVCLKCLHKEPRRRYASAQALADDLRRFLDGRPILARPVSPAEQAVKWARRRPAVAALVAAMVCTAGLAAGLVTWQWRAAVKAQREAERLATSLALRQGQALCEQGDIGRGMLLLAHALKIAPSEELRRAVRADLAGWHARLHPLRELMAHPGPVRDAVFSPDSQVILTVGADNQAPGGSDNQVRLWDAATGRPRTAPLEHPARVRSTSFSADGQLILTVADDGAARLWDATTGSIFREFQPATGRVEVAAFSPDGQSVATADGSTLRLWDPVTGQQRPHTADHHGHILALAFARKGKVLVTAGADGTAQRWDADTLRPADREAVFRLGTGKVRAAYFGPDGRTLLTLGEDAKKPDETPVHLWEVNAGSSRHIAALPHHYGVRAVAFSANGRWVCTGGEDHDAHVWDARNGEAVGRPLPHQDTVLAIAFSPDGRTVLTGSDDRTARLWNVETSRPIGPPLEHQGAVRAVGLGGPDGRTLLTASADGTARLWDAAAAVPYLREFHDDHDHDAQVMSVAWSPDGRSVLTGLDNGHAQLWQALTGEAIAPPLRHEDDILVVAFSPGGSRFLTGGRDKTVRLWSAATGKLERTLRHDHRVRSAAFSPDGRLLLTGTGDGSEGELRLWDVASGAPVGEPLEKGEIVWQVAYSPHGHTAAVALGDNTVRLWDLPARTSRPLPPLQQSRVVALAFSPDGRRLLTGSTDRTARLWDVASGQPEGEPLQHPGAVWSVAFSADGGTLVTACRDGAARLWDAATGAAVGPPCPHDGVVWAVACHPAERLFVTGSGDGRARLWPIPAPVEGDPARITLWVQLVTAMELDENGNTHWLNAHDWEECRRRLEQLGGPPVP